MDKKLLIFLSVFFVLFFVYQKFVLEPLAKKNAPLKPAAEVTEKKSPAEAPQTAQVPQSAQAQSTPAVSAPSQPQLASSEQKTVSVDTPFYHAVFNNRGAVLTSF